MIARDKVEIVRLHVSDVVTPTSHPKPNTVVPNFAYLVRCEHGTLMWDTGLGPPHAELDAAFRPRRIDLSAALARAGVSIADVDVVANCHLHFDHCGGNHRFPGVPIVVQVEELEDARGPDYTVPEWIDFVGATYEVVSGEHDIFPGIRVVPTPGHTRGHQSLMIETSDGTVVLAGQAADTAAEFEAETGEMGEIGSRSIARLKELSPIRVLFAHDDQEWIPQEKVETGASNGS